ncbi:0e6100fa-eb60-4636-bed9-88636a281dd1 [Thermothielavioides terrestris]|uniref:0e6100fa-eb60-4636-bed9-88636a281dd1 n=1 Tax=Thermothielavioides terrestris TaxID=2587410 RepID=A0A446BQ96_9PEZI|nr:0e6100fa-eb60-4636-bed9-88636a281dd1 [Thermothielavioides terrestris]
MAVALRHGDDP